MDIITKSQFDKFCRQYGFEHINESSAFELFIIYCVMSKYMKSETITKDLLNEVNIGSGGDWGIDGYVFIINGKVVTTCQEVDDLIAANNSLSVQFVFIQAKTSESFSTAELGQTLDGVEDILNDVLGKTNLPPANDDIINLRQLVKHIYTKSADFREGINPQITVYYATCGDYQEQQDYISKISKTEEFISQTDLVSSFECKLQGKREIVALYKDTQLQLSVNIKVDQRISLPEVNNISESYLCLLSFSEFRKLIISEDGEIIHDVFNDNIRAYQGDNNVNKAILNSIHQGEISLFTAMNNGITVIAKDMRTTGNNVHLVDYQIVNGCQTSYVLQKCMEVDGIDDLKLIVKLIASQDKEIRDKIIVGNNSQTEVKREQLVALLDAQKNIEDYYNAQNKYEKLYYERRSKQFRFSDAQVPSYKVITIPTQIKAFIAMMLGEPEKVRGYYGSIVEQFDRNGKKVFATTTPPALYYTSALAYYKMTEGFSLNTIHNKYKKMKFHLLLAFRLMCENGTMPPFESHRKIENYCNHLCDILCDDERCKIGFIASTQLVDKALKRDPNNADRMSLEFTKRLKEIAAELNRINRS